jgi:hypothetical protein
MKNGAFVLMEKIPNSTKKRTKLMKHENLPKFIYKKHLTKHPQEWLYYTQQLILIYIKKSPQENTTKKSLTLQ